SGHLDLDTLVLTAGLRQDTWQAPTSSRAHQMGVDARAPEAQLTRIGPESPEYDPRYPPLSVMPRVGPSYRPLSAESGDSAEEQSPSRTVQGKSEAIAAVL